MTSSNSGALRRLTLILAVTGAAALSCGNAIAAETDMNAQDRSAAEKELEVARDKLEAAAREVAKLSQQLAGNGRDALMFLGRNPNRAMLGIGIGDGDGKTQEDGVEVLSVSPDGAADKAGIKVGDLIVELNGKSLKKDKASEPRKKLLDTLAKLSPGDDVTVNYRRDGKPAVVKLKADALRRFALATPAMRGFVTIPPMPPMPEMPDLPNFGHEDGFGYVIHSRRGGVFGDVELVPLTPNLGRYFGTDKGLLVVRAPEKDSKLEDGDVLVDIDGRSPTNAGHAFRILGSYQAGEKVTLNVLRQRKKQAITLTVPEAGREVEQRREPRGRDRAIRVPLRTSPIL